MSSWSQNVALATDKDPHDPHGFNSIIGIVTAIIGNVLISIALNTQRYAHLRLNEQWLERRKLLKKAERRQLKIQTDDSITNNVKERQSRRSSTSGKSQVNGSSVESHSNGDSEHQPLLGAFRSKSGGSDEDVGSDIVGKPPEPSQQSYLKSPYWWAGIIMMTIGEAGNFLAYGFAPASIVSPLGVVAIISNCIIAPIFMKEHFRLRDFWGVVIAVGGAVTVVLSASESNPRLGPHEIWALIGTWEFETYLALTVIAITALMLASNKYGSKSIFIDIGLVGLFGGYTALSTKGVASLLSYTLFQALTFPVTYLLVAVLVFTAVMQIKYVNRALQRFNATQVIPTQFVMFTLSVILGSAVLYRDFERTSGEDAGKFVGGCALTFTGVWLITSGKRPQPDDDEDEFDDLDDDAIVLQPGEQYQDDGVLHGSQTSIRHSIAGSSIHQGRNGTFSSGVNSWDQSIGLPTTAQTLTRPPLLYPSHSQALTDGPPLNENGREESEQSSQPKLSFRRILQPLSSLFPSPSPSVPPALQARHSAPELPSATESSTSIPRTPLLQTTEDPTPLGTSPSYQHPSHPHLPRNSIASLYPGPFTSPLSSSLSAVVADSIRRRVQRRSRRSSGRIRAQDIYDGTIARSRGNSEPSDPESAQQALQSHSVDGENSNAPLEPSTPTHKRRKSLGERLGGLFRSPKKSRPGFDQNDSAGLDRRDDSIV